MKLNDRYQAHERQKLLHQEYDSLKMEKALRVDLSILLILAQRFSMI